MNFLFDIQNAAAPSTVAQSNFQKIDQSLAFMLQPSIDGTGLPTINLGPPTAAAHVVNELWVDALGAVWKCTVAGTPGTWVQVQPAVILNAVKGALVPTVDNYLVRVPDDSWKSYSWSNGGGNWTQV